MAEFIPVAESTYREWEYGRQIQGEPYVRLSERLQVPVYRLLGIENPGIDEIIREVEELEEHLKEIKLKILGRF